ncbi:MAG: hypothetical protein K6A05_05875 [Lachnospiraceae bacterium]|nr:hypothetical protein [Lachnospiraceae bacterium]
MKTIVIAWIIVAFLRVLFKFMADTLTREELRQMVFEKDVPARCMVVYVLFIISIPAEVVATIIAIINM